jgi:hypothetical protein
MDLSEFLRQIEEENSKFWGTFLEQWEKEGEELAEITKETDNLLLDIQDLSLNIL